MVGEPTSIPDPSESVMLDRAKALLAAMPQETLAELHAYLSDLLPGVPAAASHPNPAPGRRNVRRKKGTLRKEFTRCGRPNCGKCRDGGPGHGPYLYEYWREGGKTKKRYIGAAKDV
ncbi:MAG: DUF6788 family protein [Thermoplasmatota archaeon]